MKQWSLTTLRDKLIKIGAKVVHHARYVTFQLAEVAVPRRLNRAILERIRRFAALSPRADIMEIDPNQIHETRVLMTMMDGKVWHDIVFGWGDSKDDVVPDVEGLLPSSVPGEHLSH